jgi:hypothetical protein
MCKITWYITKGGMVHYDEGFYRRICVPPFGQFAKLFAGAKRSKIIQMYIKETPLTHKSTTIVWLHDRYPGKIAE